MEEISVMPFVIHDWATFCRYWAVGDIGKMLVALCLILRNTPSEWVYKTTKIDSNQMQSSGKTRNADRVVLLPDKYIALVMERKKQLQAILGPNINIDNLPIACKGDDYTNRCSADDLTEAAKILFTQLRLPPEQIIAAHDDIQRAMSADMDPLDHLGPDLLEKEPTANFLRRLYGTSLACVGLSEQDVAFQIGHDLGTVPEYRNELLNTGRLLAIKQKLDNRPVVNAVMYEKTTVLPKYGALTVDASKKQVYILAPGSSRMELHLSAKEPRDQIRVRIQYRSISGFFDSYNRVGGVASPDLSHHRRDCPKVCVNLQCGI